MIGLVPFLCGRIAPKNTLIGFGIKLGSIFVWDMDKYSTSKDFRWKETKVISEVGVVQGIYWSLGVRLFVGILLVR